MVSPAGIRPAWHILKRARMPASKIPQNARYLASNRKSFDKVEVKEEESVIKGDPERTIENITVHNPTLESDPTPMKARLPRAVQALYLRPLRRQAQYGVPTCDLQLRSYSVRSLEFFADFALRAAYYCQLPAYGPVPLPRMIERWTVPKSHFIHKKSQENFERVTLRRLIQIKDGHPESVDIWLGFLAKHQYYGVGMKANVWEYSKLGVGKEMDVTLETMTDEMKPDWMTFGRRGRSDTAKRVMEIMDREKFMQSAGFEAGYAGYAIGRHGGVK